jgi:hypothetical protein
LCAAAANFGAFVVAQIFARLRAIFADVGARAAGDSVEARMAQHEVMSDVAHLRTIHQQTDMIGISVLATFLETVVNLMKAGIVAVFAVVNALMHLGAHVFVNVTHVVVPQFCVGFSLK